MAQVITQLKLWDIHTTMTHSDLQHPILCQIFYYHKMNDLPCFAKSPSTLYNPFDAKKLVRKVFKAFGFGAFLIELGKLLVTL